MKNSKFTESQIVAILKIQDTGITVSESFSQHGISQPTFFSWKKKCSGLEASHLKRLKELEAENTRLKNV
jgi:putative transposase